MNASTKAGQKEGRLEQLYFAHAGTSQKIARLLCDDETQAVTAADAAFVRTVGLFRDLRSPLTFEASLRRAVIRACRPPLSRRFGNGPKQDVPDKPGDPIWANYSVLPHRKKAALVLRYYERLTDDQVADVLGCSTGAARSLVNRALAELQGETSDNPNASRTAGELVRLFARRVDNVVTPLKPNRSTVQRATVRRALILFAAALTSTAAVIAAFVLLG